MGAPGITHETDERLELYALGRLPESSSAAVEEHLLICATCQERLDDVGAFALSMRQAISESPADAERTDWFAWLRQPAYRWAGACAALVLATGLYLSLGSSRVAPLASLQLTAMRGDIQSTEMARETDITLADAPPESGLRVEVVDSTGATVWTASPEALTGSIRITRQLAQGSYFVRLFDGTGKLLHEYGFRVRPNL